MSQHNFFEKSLEQNKKAHFDNEYHINQVPGWGGGGAQTIARRFFGLTRFTNLKKKPT